MVKLVVAWFGALAACMAFEGCKPSDGGAAPVSQDGGAAPGSQDGGAASVSQDDLPDALANIVCDSFGSCCSSSGFAFDSTNCRATVVADTQKLLDTVLTPAVGYDAQAAKQCLSEIKKRIECGSTESIGDIPVCSLMFVGTSTAGQPCATDTECVKPGSCDRDIAAGRDVCNAAATAAAVVVGGKLGDTCSATCESVESCRVPFIPSASTDLGHIVVCYGTDSLYCVGTCQQLKALGEPCEEFGTCKEGLFCGPAAVGDAGAPPGVCTALLPNGAMCSSPDVCQSRHCKVDVNTAKGICYGTSVTAQECASGKRDK